MDNRRWVILAIAFFVTLVGVWFIPSWEKAIWANTIFPSDGPGAFTVLGVGILTSGFAALCMYFFAREHQLPGKFLSLAIAFSILLVVTKFVIGPVSLYDANRKMEFNTMLFDNSPLSIIFASFGVFLLYILVLWIIYKIHKHKANPDAKSAKMLKWIGLWLIIGVLIIIGGWFFLLIFLLPGIGYLGYLFSSGISILIALAIIVAAVLLNQIFTSLRELTKAVRNASILTSFFWVAASIIFVFHALWVVYMLALVAAWPLRTVTPK